MDQSPQRRSRGRGLRRTRRGFLYLLGALSFASLPGCQLGYYAHSAYYQSKMINERESIDRMLRSSSLSDEQKRKLRLVQDVKAFGEKELGLKRSSNYTSYVQLDSPYVTYIVQAAQAWEMKPYLFSFPLVGKMPYKGYFRRDLAEREAASFNKDDYDTFVRGVTAYSTLGWFQDSVLSSMLRYEDYDLVELILHETVHTTLFIKNGIDFNERLATFLGHEGMKRYYLAKEGPSSKQLRLAEDDSHDQKLFSTFITRETENLKKWYEDNKGKVTRETKAARLAELRAAFMHDLKPKLKTQNYREFETRELNNALLLAYQTYEYGLEDFEKLFAHFGGDYGKTLAYLKTLESSPDPSQALKEFVAGFPVGASGATSR